MIVHCWFRRAVDPVQTDVKPVGQYWYSCFRHVQHIKINKGHQTNGTMPISCVGLPTVCCLPVACLLIEVEAVNGLCSLLGSRSRLYAHFQLLLILKFSKSILLILVLHCVSQAGTTIMTNLWTSRGAKEKSLIQCTTSKYVFEGNEKARGPKRCFIAPWFTSDSNAR